MMEILADVQRGASLREYMYMLYMCLRRHDICCGSWPNNGRDRGSKSHLKQTRAPIYHGSNKRRGPTG